MTIWVMVCKNCHKELNARIIPFRCRLENLCMKCFIEKIGKEKSYENARKISVGLFGKKDSITVPKFQI